MIKGWKKLTKKERNHLIEQGCHGTALFQLTINEQQKMRDRGEQEPCYDCKFIAKKLGMEPEVTNGNN